MFKTVALKLFITKKKIHLYSRKTCFNIITTISISLNIMYDEIS